MVKVSLTTNQNSEAIKGKKLLNQPYKLKIFLHGGIPVSAMVN